MGVVKRYKGNDTNDKHTDTHATENAKKSAICHPKCQLWQSKCHKITPTATRNTGNGNRKNPTGLSLPEVIEVIKEEWDTYEFDRYSALKVLDSGNSSYDFYVNIDNLYLLNEIKPRKDDESELLRTKFKFGLVLIGLSLLNDRSKNDEENDETPEEYVFQVTKALSPVLIPIIEALGTLQMDEA